jgi:hypothetical protein
MSEPRQIKEFKDFILQSDETKVLLENHFHDKSLDTFGRIKEIANKHKSYNKNLLIDISKLIDEWKKENPESIMESFRNGDDEDNIYSIIQDRLDFGPSEEEEIPACGSDGEFNINICKAGPLYLIRANDFDDILWFSSLEEAVSHAKEYYSDFIDDKNENDDVSSLSDEMSLFKDTFKDSFKDSEEIAHTLDSFILFLALDKNLKKTYKANLRSWAENFPLDKAQFRSWAENLHSAFNNAFNVSLNSLIEKEIKDRKKIIKKNQASKNYIELNLELIDDLQKLQKIFPEDDTLRDLVISSVVKCW